MPTIAHVKAVAKSTGVRWSDVVEIYRDLRSLERPTVEHDHAIRRRIWEQYCWTPACIDFWFVGMQRRFSRAFGDGDRTLIPGFDLMAAALAEEYPQFAGDDPSDLVWEFLNTSPARFSDAGRLYNEALDLVLANERVAIPF